MHVSAANPGAPRVDRLLTVAIQFAAQIVDLLDRVRARAARDGIIAYAVGGSVRDALLVRDMHDLDIAVDRDALAFGRRLAADLDGHFVELDDVNSIARVVLDDGPVRYVDVAQLQGAIDDDLRRRDFTIDAIAIRLGESRLIDVTGGVDDLNRRIVRMTAPEVFADDPLRLLRCARLASELIFTVDPDTEALVRSRASTVLTAAAERRRGELARIFALDDAYGGVQTLDRLGLLDVLLPELARGRDVSQPGGFHAFDVFEHNLRALEAMDVMLMTYRPERPSAWLWDAFWAEFTRSKPALRSYLAEEMSEGRTRAALLKFATLLHDVAKPATLTIGDDGGAHFYGHSDLGAEMASRIMRRLRFSSREVRFVSSLVSEHLRPVQLSAIGEVPTRRALYRFYRDLGDAMPAVLLLALADAASARGLIDVVDQTASERWTDHVRYMNSLLVRSIEGEGILDPPRLLTGGDIMGHLGLGEGPLIGRLLEAVREAQAAGEVHSVSEALALAERLAADESHQGGDSE